MKPPKFHVGQAVVCTSGPVGKKGPVGMIEPIVGQRYHVRHVSALGEDGNWSVCLMEIVNSPRHYEEGWTENAFLESRFTPAHA